jgi:hypothetical protein
VIPALGPMVLAISLAAQPAATVPLKSEYWVSHIGLFQVKVPKGWQMAVRAAGEGMLEDLRLGPTKEPTVAITILTRRYDRPMTSIDCDLHMKGLLKKYRKDFTDVAIRQAMMKVPLGNEQSWGYLLIYNTKASDGSKVSVHETVNYVNRRMADRAYLHHIIVGRVPLPVAYSYSLPASKVLREMVFQQPTKAAPVAADADEGDEGDEEDAAAEAAGASPAPSPAPAAPKKDKKAKNR